MKRQWKYRYRAVDSAGNPLDFLLSARHDAKAAERFFRQALRASHPIPPRGITVDKKVVYSCAVETMKQAEPLPQDTPLRQVKDLNNGVEQAHGFIKRRVKPGFGFTSFHTAWRTLRSYEIMHRIPKGQVREVARGDVVAQRQFIGQLFGSLPKLTHETGFFS